MQGENITASYISVLKNTEGRTASESVSRAIAKATASVIEIYVDGERIAAHKRNFNTFKR
jgi:hypothetical protein